MADDVNSALRAQLAAALTAVDAEYGVLSAQASGSVFSTPSALQKILNGRVEVRGLRRAHILDVMAALDVVSAGMAQLGAGGYPGPVKELEISPDVLAKAREELAALGGLVNIVLPPDPPASVRAKAA
jgi:hypothetical protein